jgi:hypothetical protein
MRKSAGTTLLPGIVLAAVALVALVIGGAIAVAPALSPPPAVTSATPTARPTPSAAQRRFLATARGAYPELASVSDGSIERTGRLACRIFSEGGLWSDVLAELATEPAASQSRDAALVAEGTSDFCPQYSGLVRLGP